MSKPRQYCYEFGPFRLNASERLLLRDGKRVPLAPKVFDTLLTHGQSGRREETLSELEALKALWSRRYFSPFRMALIYAALGDADSTFAWLEQGYQMRDARLIFLKVDPGLDPVRSDARYYDLMRRVGLKHNAQHE
jgi:hypothetical protein